MIAMNKVEHIQQDIQLAMDKAQPCAAYVRVKDAMCLARSGIATVYRGTEYRGRDFSHLVQLVQAAAIRAHS